jgi:hypothetical protein
MASQLAALNRDGSKDSNSIFDIQGAVGAIYGGAVETVGEYATIFRQNLTL